MSEIPLIIIPDDDDPDCANIFVNGTIGGRPYRFLLDTGAAGSGVVVDAFTSTFTRVGENRGSSLFAGGVGSNVEAPDITVGSLHWQEVTVGLDEVQCLVGMDLLKNHILHFRFDCDTLAVDEPGDRHAAALDLYLPETSHPYVDIHFGDTVGSAVWDSGAGITVVDENFRRRHPELFRAAGFSMGTDGSGTQIETPTWIVADSVIGGATFAEHRAAAIDLSGVNATIERPMDFILGYPAFSQANWLFDFPARRWAVTDTGNQT